MSFKEQHLTTYLVPLPASRQHLSSLSPLLSPPDRATALPPLLLLLLLTHTVRQLLALRRLQVCRGNSSHVT